MKRCLLQMVLLTHFLSGAAWATGNDDPEERYVRHNASAEYSIALETLAVWTGHEESPDTVELNLFRIEELADAGLPPGEILAGLDAIENANVLFRRNGFLKARLSMIRCRALLGMGRPDEASAVAEAAGYIGQFRITGPFANANARDFDMRRGPENGSGQDKSYHGKLHSVEWFDARPGRTGCYDPGEMGLETSEALYYFSTDISIPGDGEYYMIVGKTGFMDASVDGVPVFSSRKRHSYHHDQYLISLRLAAGRHTVTIKAGDSLDGIRLSVRFADSSGNGIKVSGVGGERAGNEPVRAGRVSFFHGLSTSLQAAPGDARMAFVTGYLFLRSGLDSEDEGEAMYWLDRSSGSPGPGCAAEYYAGLCEDETGRKEERFKNVLARMPLHYDALAGMAGIKVGNGFYHDAIPLLERMREINGSAGAAYALYSAVYNARGWHEESLKAAIRLINAGHEAEGHRLAGETWRTRRMYSQAAREYTAALNCDHSSKTLIRNALFSSMQCGNYFQARSLLERSIRLYPADASLRYELAGLVRNTEGPESAIPFYAAVFRVNPYHAGALEGMGKACYSLNRVDVAMEYFNRALASAPGNFALREYVDSLRGGPDSTDGRRISDEIEDLVERGRKYPDEPVVTLLDESIIDVHADGSAVKKVRRVYLIQDTSGAQRLARQHVLYSPDTDCLEEFKCIVINEGERLEVSDRSSMSLSEPESSMYYDQRAEIISVPALKRGSVLEVRYRIRHDAREAYRGYFGESMVLGSENRILAFNFVVSFPADRDVYCFIKKGSRLPLAESSDGKKKRYQVLARDVAPVGREIGMPHLSDLAPRAYFSTLKDWGEIHRWYASLAKNRSQASGEMKRQIGVLLGDGDSQIEKVKKIFKHVSGMVRYAGFELGIGGLQPRNAGDTYAARMGDCKDVALVLVAMLREAGIDARLALVRTRDRGSFDRDMPFLGQFNHALCYAAVDEGVFLDATAKMTGIGELPADDRYIDAFVMDENGYEFISTSRPINDRSSDTVVNEVSIDEAGNALIKRSMHKGGSLAGGARIDLLDADEKLSSISEYWSGRYPGSSVKNLRVQSVDPDKPVEYTYDIEIRNLARQHEGVGVIRTHLMTSDYYARYAFRQERKLPVVLRDRWHTSVTTRFHLPAGFMVSVLPEGEEFRGGKFHARFRIEKKDDSIIEVIEQIDFHDDVILPRDYAMFRKFALFIQRKENESMTIRKIPVK